MPVIVLVHHSKPFPLSLSNWRHSSTVDVWPQKQVKAKAAKFRNTHGRFVGSQLKHGSGAEFVL